MKFARNFEIGRYGLKKYDNEPIEFSIIESKLINEITNSAAINDFGLAELCDT